MRRYYLISRIILAFLIVTIPITFLLFSTTSYSKMVIREEVAQSNNNLLTMYMDKIDSDLTMVDTYLYKMMSANSYLFSKDGRVTNYPEYILSIYSLKEQLYNDLYLYPVVDVFFLYDNESHSIVETSSLLDSEKTLGNVLLGMDERSSFLPWTVLENDNKAFLIKMLKVKGSLYLGVYMNIENVMPLNMHFSEGTFIAITDEEGKVVGGDKPLQNLCSVEPKEDNSAFTLVEDDNNLQFLLTSAKSQIAPLTLKAAFQERVMLNSLYQIQKIQYIAPVLVAAALLMCIYFLKTTLIKPVSILEKSMKSIKIGEWDTHIEENWKGEFFNIANGFNEMVNCIHSLKIAMYDEQLKVQKTEYQYLEMQINPHFLMNTMNIIYNMAALKDYVNVQKLSIYMTNYYRYIMKNSQQLVEINDEIENMKNFLEIQKTRFGDNLSYSVDVKTVKDNYFIPTMTIQPFVENSIKHGYKLRSKQFHISIRVAPYLAKPEEYYELILQDSGVGFSQDYLEFFYKQWNQEQYIGHIGIENTLKRLRLRYKDKFLLQLENGIEGGAIVHIIMPYGNQNSVYNNIN